MENENEKFKQEIEDYKCNTTIKTVMDSYTAKFESINQLIRKSDDYKK